VIRVVRLVRLVRVVKQWLTSRTGRETMATGRTIGELYMISET